MRKRLLALAAGLLTAVPPLVPQVFLPPALAQTVQSQRMVVLPFENLTRAAEDEWLREGFADSLTLSLARVASLQLIERNRIDAVIKEIGFGQSALADQGSAPQLGKLYGAQLVALGSFQRVGEQIRISVRLVDVETGTIQTQSITQVEGAHSQLFALQQQLGDQLIAKLASGQALAPAQPADTSSPAAQEAYIKGHLALENRGSDARLQEAIGLLSEATRLDPRHARAHASLSQAYLVRSRSPEFYPSARPDDRRQAGEEARLAVSLAPSLVAGHVALARWLMAEKQTEPAAASLETALRLDPSHRDAILAWIDLRSPLDLKSLQQELQRLKANLDDPWIQLELANAYVDQQGREPGLDLAPAHDLLAQAARQLPDYFIIPFYQGALAYRQREYGRSITYLKRSYELEPNFYASFMLVQTHLALSQYTEAKTWIDKTLALAPGHGWAYWALGNLHAHQNQPEAAAAAFEKAHQLMPEAPDPLVSLAWTRFNQNRSQDARRLMEQAVSLAVPGSLDQARYRMFLGDFALYEKDLAQADTRYSELAQDLRLRPDLLTRQAHLAAARKDYARARALYASFIQEFPEQAAAAYHQNTYRIFYLQEQLGKDPKNPALLNDLGQLTMQEGRLPMAQGYLEDALALAPDNPVILYNAGSLALKQQRWADAVSLLEQATLLKPDYIKAWYNLALARQGQNQPTQARAALERVLSLDPAHAEAGKLLQSLRP